MAANKTLAGVVLDDQGRPCKGAHVYYSIEGQSDNQSQTDNNGRFVIKDLCPGPIQLSFNDLKGAYGSASAQGGDTNVVIRLGARFRNRQVQAIAPNNIPGIVVDPDNKPASNVRLTVFPSGLNKLTTDPQGKFVLIFDSGGTFGGTRQHTVFAIDPLRNLASSLDLNEESTNADMKLEPAWILAGRVTDTENNAVTNAQVELILRAMHTKGTYATPVDTDQEGRFEFKCLPCDRSFDVSVSAKGYSRSIIRGESPNTATNRLELETVQLTAANLTVAGVVLDENDQPVKGAWIYCSGTTESMSSMGYRTDSRGRFFVKGISPGRVDISASDTSDKSGSAEAEAGDTNIVIRFVKPVMNAPVPSPLRSEQKLSGVVTDPVGNPASGVDLFVYPLHRGNQATDDQGRFALSFSWDGDSSGPSQFVLIAFDRARNLAASLDLEESATNIHLKLEPAWTLAGRIVDTDGNGVADAQAELLFQSLALDPYNVTPRPGGSRRPLRD